MKYDSAVRVTEWPESLQAMAHPAPAEASVVFAGGDAGTRVPLAGAATLQPETVAEGIQIELPSSLSFEPQPESGSPMDQDLEDQDDADCADDLPPAVKRLPNLEWKKLASQVGSLRDVLVHVRRSSSGSEVRRSSTTSEPEPVGDLECTKQERVRILWMKALWYATQEAKRRRSANIAWRKQQRRSKAAGFSNPTGFTLIEHTGIVLPSLSPCSLFVSLFGVCMHTNMYACTRIRTHIRTHVRTNMYTYSYMHMLCSRELTAHVHTLKHAHAHSHARARTHTHTHTHRIRVQAWGAKPGIQKTVSRTRQTHRRIHTHTITRTYTCWRAHTHKRMVQNEKVGTILKHTLQFSLNFNST